ncbi:hypothetical protein BGZ83_009660 [Gryganskiella cystojenkinii]|nr:hypothetical protein BGZ83_009660 [Gryganskiella cystojenkinii]
MINPTSESSVPSTLVEMTFRWRGGILIGSSDDETDGVAALIPEITTLRIHCKPEVFLMMDSSNADASTGLYHSMPVRDPLALKKQGVTATSMRRLPQIQVVLSKNPVRLLNPSSTLDLPKLRLDKKRRPSGHSLLCQFLNRAAREAVVATATPLFLESTINSPRPTAKTGALGNALTAAVNNDQSTNVAGGDARAAAVAATKRLARSSDVQFVVDPATYRTYRVTTDSSTTPTINTTTTPCESRIPYLTGTIPGTPKPATPCPLSPVLNQHYPQFAFEQVVAAHRSILRLWPEFATLIENHPRPDELVLQLKCPPGLDLSSLQSVINFLYLGQIQGVGHHFYYSYARRQQGIEEATSTAVDVSDVEEDPDDRDHHVVTNVIAEGSTHRNGSDIYEEDSDWRKIFQIAHRFGVQPLVELAIERLCEEHEGYQEQDLAGSNPRDGMNTPCTSTTKSLNDEGEDDYKQQQAFGTSVKKMCPIQTLFQWAYQYPVLETRLMELILNHFVVVVAAIPSPESRHSGGALENWERPQQQQHLILKRRARMAVLQERLGPFRTHAEFSRINGTILERILEQTLASNFRSLTLDFYDATRATKTSRTTTVPTFNSTSTRDTFPVSTTVLLRSCQFHHPSCQFRHRASLFHHPACPFQLCA